MRSARSSAIRDRQLRDSQALAHVGSWEWDLSEPLIWWSDELCRIYGREPGFTPSPDQGLDHVHPDDRERLRDVVSRSLTGELTFRIVRVDGAIRHVHARRDARHDADGVVRSMFGTIQDVTDRLAAESGRDAALDLLQGAFEHGAVGMSLVGVDGRWLRVNRALCRITGYSEAELLAGRFQDITHPEDLSADHTQVARCLAGEIDEYQMEKRYLTADGGFVWVLLSVALVRDAGGEPLHFVGQVQDISARRDAECKLRAAEADARRERDYAQAIIAAMHEGYALTIDAEVIAVNQAMCEMLGYPEAELVGLRPPYPFWAPDSRRTVLEAGETVTRTGAASCEVTVDRRDGTQIEVEIAMRAAQGDLGSNLGIVHTWRDVSDRNRLQRELERRARTDSLTGLANRDVLRQTLTQECRRHERDTTLAIVLFDLDHFKQVNDRHGHPVGDAVLVEVARRLTAVTRGGEVLARVGGEEFAWLLPNCDAAGAQAAAARARAVVTDTPFDTAGRMTMSAGIGIAAIPCDGDETYALADRALYDAKQGGRDRTCVRGVTDLISAELAAGGRRFDVGTSGGLDVLTGAITWYAESADGVPWVADRPAARR